MDRCEMLRRAEEIQPGMIRIRRRLHKSAETGFELEKTLECVREELDELGLSHRKCGRAGLIADIGSGDKTVLLRADMDALPMVERSGEAFASTNGACHACGHDMHTAMLLGAARLLTRFSCFKQGRVRLMFQPAEEIFSGAKDMLSSGLLEGCTIKGAVMLHVLTPAPYCTGTLIMPQAGAGAPSADHFEIEIRGRGCHGSTPECGIDPISAAGHIIVGLEEIKAREISGGDRVAMSIGRISAGEAANVIPDSVSMSGTLRSFDEKLRERVKTRIGEISGAIAGAFRASAELSFTCSCPGFYNDAGVLEAIEPGLRECFGERLVRGAGGGGGSEDFAYVSRLVPTAMLALCAGSPEKGYVHGLHHPAVRFDEAAMPAGAAALAISAMELLRKGEPSAR